MKLKYRLVIAITIFLQTTYLFSQDLPVINKTGKHSESFVPKGWEIIGQTKGDINKDGLEDFMLAIKDIEEDMNDDKEYSRLLLVLFGTKDKLLTLYVSTGKAILCKRCGGVFGDPFQSLVLKDGELSIEHFGGSTERWGITDFFRWNGKDFILVKETRSSANVNDPDNSYKEKIKTATDFGKVLLQDFDINKEM